MKNLQDRIAELKSSIGLERSNNPPKIEKTKFNYSEQRKLYEQLANHDLEKLQQVSRQQRVEQLQGRSELNPKWTFDNLIEDAQDVKEAVSIAKSFISAHRDPKWRKSRSHMMIFYGDYGRGKSHIAGAIAHELIKRYETSVLYRQLQTLLDMRLFSYDYQSQDNAPLKYREVNQQLHDVDLLILDEVCVNETVLKKNAQAWLGNLLRQRKIANKNVILITNHNLHDLEAAIGRYCFESIKEYETYQVNFQGPSRRNQITQPTELVRSQQSKQNKSGYQPNQINYDRKPDF